MKTSVVAFLQNMWFKDPQRMKKIYDRYLEREEDGRQLFIRDFLFFGCLTGRRLDQAFEPIFGDEWRWRVTWEEVSQQWGDHSGSVFAHDVQHVGRVIEKYDPKVILVFGKVAAKGVVEARIESRKIIYGPHPAARHATVVSELRTMAETLAIDLIRLETV